MTSEFHYADYIVFSITIVISLSIGIYYACSGNKQRTNAEYFVGNRSMKILPVLVSVLVSAESSVMMLGMAAEIYIHGCMFYISIIAYMFGIIFAAYFIVPIVHPLNLTSIYEYLELRFKSRAVRILASTLAKMITLFYMGIVLLGPALAIKAVLGFPVIWSILIVCGVSVIYTTIGGFKAVIWADVFQGVVMLIGLLAVLIKGTIESGGPSEVFRLGEEGRRLDMWNFDPDPRVRHTFFTLIFGGFTTMIGRALEQASMQRVFSVPKMRDAQKLLYIAGPMVTITMGIACFQGLVAYAYYSKLACDPLAARRITNPNQIIPLLVIDMFSSYPGMSGLYMASLCSASFSTLSSGYGSLSAQTVKDFIEPLTNIQSEKAKLFIAKLSVVLYGSISVGISILLSSLSGSFISIVIGLLGSISGPVTGMILLAALVPFANSKGALIGTLFGLSLTSWITAGRILSPTLMNTPTLPPAPSDNCPITNSTMTPFNYTMEAFIKIDYYKQYEPKGADNIYSLSYIIIGGIGMLTALVVGIIVSWITGCNPAEEGDEI
ncbi:sodium-coupled monocarboxylate transporter 1 isoform X2 [Patella vulgata]|nr:sodium-coupled monocarboxylate transporter 1 isoform X2 [Patella vulgata]